MRIQFVSLTPKALRLDELLAQGMSFDEALTIADSEYSSDGVTLKSSDVSPTTRRTAVLQEQKHLSPGRNTQAGVEKKEVHL